MTKRKRAPRDRIKFYAVGNTVIYETWTFGFVHAKRLSLVKATKFAKQISNKLDSLQRAITAARKSK